MKDLSVPENRWSYAPSSALLDRLRNQEQSGWDRLVSLYAPLLFHWCVRAGLQRMEIEDVCQEVFLVVAHNIKTYRHDRVGETFRDWLRTILRNKIVERTVPSGATRSGDSDGRHLLQLPNADPVENLESDAEELGILYRCAVELIENEFEPSSYQAFWQVIQGRRPADVATELEISECAVYLAKSRISKRLRDEFDGVLEIPTAVRHLDS